jgi:hypothetical protein
MVRLESGDILAGRAVAPGRAVVITEEVASLWLKRLNRHRIVEVVSASHGRRAGRRSRFRQHDGFGILTLARSTGVTNHERRNPSDAIANRNLLERFLETQIG